MNGLEVVPGLYDRGASDKVRENPKRTISHDNISAIACISNMLGTRHAAEIASYGLRNLGVYNNNQKGFRLPMNPGNYSIWLALANKSKLLQILFLPFFLINFIITMNKKREETSSRLLYFVELYPLRNTKYWGKLYKLYKDLIVSTYGGFNFGHILPQVLSIYFKDVNHPINVLARRI